MNIWRYILDGKTFGPVELEQLQRLADSGMITPETQVQKEGMTEWVPARSVAGLVFSSGRPAASSIIPNNPQPGAPPRIQNADAEDVEKNRIFAILAYIGILFIVPLLAAPNSKFARYHANQGMVLFVATVILWLGFAVLMMTPLGCLMWIGPFVVSLGSVILMVIGIVNAAKGECKPLPLIGHFRLLT